MPLNYLISLGSSPNLASSQAFAHNIYVSLLAQGRLLTMPTPVLRGISAYLFPRLLAFWVLPRAQKVGKYQKGKDIAVAC